MNKTYNGVPIIASETFAAAKSYERISLAPKDTAGGSSAYEWTKTVPYIKEAAESIKGLDDISKLLIFSDNEEVGKKVGLYLFEIAPAPKDGKNIWIEGEICPQYEWVKKLDKKEGVDEWSIKLEDEEEDVEDEDGACTYADVCEAMADFDDEGLLAELDKEDDYYDDEEDDYYDDEEDDTEDDVITDVSNGSSKEAIAIDLSGIVDTDTKGPLPGLVNPYLEYMNQVLQDPLNSRVVITGFKNAEDLSIKLDTVAALRCQKKAIILPAEYAKAPFVYTLMEKHNFVPIYISKVKDSYFAGVLERELDKEGLKLEDATLMGAVSYIRNRVCDDASQFSEEKIIWAVGQAKKHTKTDRGTIILKDLVPGSEGEDVAQKRLKELVGIDEDIKTWLKERIALAAGAEKNPALHAINSSYIFAGNPGTGKTTIAELLSNMLIQNGLCTSKLTKAARSDIIGKYVGHTAPKIKALFEKSRGGILFIDEAGFFTHSDSGGFVEEAVKELTRYITQYPDVTVILAMYLSEADKFMKLDDGLKSRLEVVHFRDYTDDEMCEIFKRAINSNGYELQPGYRNIVKTYFASIRRTPGFGNARTAIKLSEAALKVHLVNDYEKGGRETKVITLEEIKKGIMKRRPTSESTPKRIIGFSGYAEATAQ